MNTIYRIEWPDRRSLAQMILASFSAVSATNPRGWFNDPLVNVITPAGVAAFQIRLLQLARLAVDRMRSWNAQGAVTWDIEGEPVPPYIGDPPHAEIIAPELIGVVDQYFQTFTDAGFRVGVTVRPQLFTVPAGPQIEVIDAAGQLRTKIRFAHDRWGCTLFFIDSLNIGILGEFEFINLASEFPDCLLIPEHGATGMYQAAAHYAELRPPEVATDVPASILATVPNAFVMIFTGDGDFSSPNGDQLIGGLRQHGNILMWRAFFDSKEAEQVAAIYKAANV